MTDKLALEKAIDFIESLTRDPLLLPDDIEMTLADVQAHARIELASIHKVLEAPPQTNELTELVAKAIDPDAFRSDYQERYLFKAWQDQAAEKARRQASSAISVMRGEIEPSPQNHTTGYRNENWKTDDAELESALDAFWNVAYTQGQENRGHDDEAGTAQKADDELRRIIASRAAPAPQNHTRTVAELPMTAFADAAPQRDEFNGEQTILTYNDKVGIWDLAFFESGEEFPEKWFGDTHWIDITGMWPGVIAQVASFTVREVFDNG